METLIQGPETGWWFAWNGAHTVNVRQAPGGPDLDCYSIGDWAVNHATHEEFLESVHEYEEER